MPRKGAFSCSEMRIYAKLNCGDFVKVIDKYNTIWYNGIKYQMMCLVLGPRFRLIGKEGRKDKLIGRNNKFGK